MVSISAFRPNQALSQRRKLASSTATGGACARTVLVANTAPGRQAARPSPRRPHETPTRMRVGPRPCFPSATIYLAACGCCVRALSRLSLSVCPERRSQASVAAHTHARTRRLPLEAKPARKL
ncbi:unnamed protein product [Periconia digitata]|uniref:Uncharacterized protein n=1 Tax=Periconia digitata TaxID=1303443 RepID=A0A9W4U8B6_9PLEO|nr:unnamed protein product [Periconia digitata]